jgi:hypothetical protein
VVVYDALKDADKSSVLNVVNNTIASVQSIFAKSTKGNVKKGINTTLNFEDCMRAVIKDATKVMKSYNKAAKKMDDAEIATTVQSIGKASTTVMNVVLKDYMNMAGSIKLMLNEAIKKMSGSLSEGGKSA